MYEKKSTWLRMKGKVQPKRKKAKKVKEDHGYEFILRLKLQVSSFNSNRMEGKEMITTNIIVVVTTN